MYTLFYNLKLKPFQISSDPAFLWLGEKHKEALATLRYGVLDNKGFLLLTGDVGTGKTTLINTLIRSLGHDVICTTVPDPNLERLDFYNYIANGFGIDREFTSKGTFLVQFSHFLHKAYIDNKKVVLIIDESQLLTQELLEEIRLLSNIEKADAKLLNIFFVGQNEFNEILARTQNRAVRQRLTLNYNIEPLTPDETGEYIKHRLYVAGTDKKIFNPDAVHKIHLYSRGMPRRINIICDHALLTGYVQEKKNIDESIIHECARELNIPANEAKRDFTEIKDKFDKRDDSEIKTDSQRNKLQKEDNSKKDSPARGGFWYIAALILVLIIFAGSYVVDPGLIRDSFIKAHGYAVSLRTVVSEFVHREISSSKPSELSLSKPGESYSPEHAEVKDSPDPTISEKIIKEITDYKRDFLKKNLVNNVTKNEKSFKTEDGQPKTEDGQPKTEDGQPKVKKSRTETKSGSEAKFEAEIKSGAEVKSGPGAASGTAIEIPPLPKAKVRIRFKYNTNDFTDKGLDSLNRFARIIEFYPEVDIILKGYTDSHGNFVYNRKLSEFRANIIRSFLLGKGVAPEKIKAIGMGSKNPIESNDTVWGRQMNRRVEIEIE